jgi:hypothetical protein
MESEEPFRLLDTDGLKGEKQTEQRYAAALPLYLVGRSCIVGKDLFADFP